MEARTDRYIDTTGNSDGFEAWVCGRHIEGVHSTVLLSCIVNDEVGVKLVNVGGLASIWGDVSYGEVDTNPLLPQSVSIRMSINMALLRRI